MREQEQHYFPDVIPNIPEDEKWITHYVGYYTIRKDGEVFSYHKEKRQLKQQLFKSRKSLTVRLTLKNDGCVKDVHTLVAEAFLDNPDGHCHVIFKDGNRLNVHSDNLSWFPSSRLGELPSGCVWIPSYEGLYYMDFLFDVYNKTHKKLTPYYKKEKPYYTLIKNKIKKHFSRDYLIETVFS